MNPFDETFQRAIDNNYPLRRVLSVPNDEDTLHTPHIIPHGYTTTTVPVTESPTAGTSAAVLAVNPDLPPPAPPRQPRRGDSLSNKKKSVPPVKVMKPVRIQAPILPLPEAIQIEPRWTVVVKYPAGTHNDRTTVPAPEADVKGRLKRLILKNQTSTRQKLSIKEQQDEGRAGGGKVYTITVPREKRAPITEPTTNRNENLDRNNAAVRRYRNKMKDFYSQLKVRNEELETENADLRKENEELRRKLQEALSFKR